VVYSPNNTKKKKKKTKTKKKKKKKKKKKNTKTNKTKQNERTNPTGGKYIGAGTITLACTYTLELSVVIYK
jgi:hypothetical protein